MPSRYLLILFAAFLFAGCSATTELAELPPATEFERVVYGVPVVDADGRAYDHPWLGGLDVPRPQLVDIDGDGDKDLFLQEFTGKVMFFEADSAGGFTWKSDAYEGLDVGDWFRFADLDQDGDIDLLGEQRFSYVKAFENVGSPTAPQFVLRTDTLLGASGDPIFAERQNILNLVDLDCDQKLDLFIGMLTGTITRYESVSAAGELPRFELVTENFEGIEIIGEEGLSAELPRGSLHGANTLAFHDVDADGDQDLFWGDYFEPGLLFIENYGTCEAPDFRDVPTPFPQDNPIRTSGYNAPAFGDLTQNGVEDLLVGVLGGAYNASRSTVENLHRYVHLDGIDFEKTDARALYGLDVGSEATPHLADLDADGDLDLLLSNKLTPGKVREGDIVYFENQAGTFVQTDTLNLSNTFHQTPAPADLDGDGDLDLIVGSWNRKLAFVRNVGTAQVPEFELVDDEFVTIPRGSNTVPTLADLDGDGDHDLIVGEAVGTLNHFENVGSPEEPAFRLVAEDLAGIDIGRRAYPVLIDFDADGDHDLIVGNEIGELALYRNDGGPSAPDFVLDESFSLKSAPFAAPAFGDLTGDGRRDLLLGTSSGGVRLYVGL